MHSGAFVKLLCVWLSERFMVCSYMMCIRERLVCSVRYMLVKVSECLAHIYVHLGAFGKLL